MAPRSRKRAKNSTTTTENVVLKGFIGMPIDIVFEIFEYLDPLDLLRLARTTKFLRAILMSRSSLSLWKRVRHAYYQMPDGPEGMSELRYASLALDRKCDACGVSGSYYYSRYDQVHTFWHAELKSCYKCESDLLANKSNLKKLDLSQALPSWLTAHLQKIDDLFLYSSYSLKQVQIWSQEYASLRGSSANLKEWQRRIIEKNARTQEHIESFQYWSLLQAREKLVQHSRLVRELLIKLKELGWSEEINKMYSFESDDLFHKFSRNYELGSFSQVWSSNGPAILRDLKAIQNARLKKEREMLFASRYVVLQEIYNEYIRGLPADALIPTLADVALSPSVDAIIKDERPDFIVTRQTFGDINLMQTLPSIFSEWKIRLDDELVRMVQVELSEPFTKDQLLLATTVFYCGTCHIDLFYPRVLIHRCPTPKGIVVNSLKCPASAWNSSRNIKFDRNIHQAAIDIIDILGLDPKTVTAEDMTVKNSVLQCLDCMATPLGRMTMIWSRAIEHSRNHNHLPSMISWNVPGYWGQLTLQTRLARALAEREYCLDSVWARPRFMCGVCRLEGTLVRLNEHLFCAHGIRNPGKRDILSHPDVLQAPPPCFLPETD